MVREEIAALNHYHEIAADDVLPRVVETSAPIAYVVEDAPEDENVAEEPEEAPA